jgi:HEAT repeat protein
MADRLAADHQRALAAALRSDPSPEVRAEAAFSLALRSAGGDDEGDVAAALWSAIDDGPEVARRAAVLALGYKLDDPTAHRLVRLLVDAPELWREVATALAGYASPAIEDQLEETLETASEARSRRGAARALGLTRQPPGPARRGAARGGQRPDGDREALEDHPFFGYEDASGVLHPLL